MKGNTTRGHHHQAMREIRTEEKRHYYGRKIFQVDKMYIYICIKERMQASIGSSISGILSKNRTDRFSPIFLLWSRTGIHVSEPHKPLTGVLKHIPQLMKPAHLYVI